MQSPQLKLKCTHCNAIDVANQTNTVAMTRPRQVDIVYFGPASRSLLAGQCLCLVIAVAGEW